MLWYIVKSVVLILLVGLAFDVIVNVIKYFNIKRKSE